MPLVYPNIVNTIQVIAIYVIFVNANINE